MPTAAAPADGQSTFATSVGLHDWQLPAREWLERHEKSHEWDGLATACVVFNAAGRVLVVQRAAHDSMPNKWELPGGAVDDEDPTILHGAARELLEESGLIASRFNHIITEGPNQEPGQVFPNSTKTKTWCRFTFEVDVEDCESVRLDPEEHQDYVWASEAEIREQKTGSRTLPITRESMVALILEAFRLRNKHVGQSLTKV